MKLTVHNFSATSKSKVIDAYALMTHRTFLLPLTWMTPMNDADTGESLPP